MHSVLIMVLLEIQSQNSCAEQQNKDSVKLFQQHSVLIDLTLNGLIGAQQVCSVVQLHTLYVLQTHSNNVEHAEYIFWLLLQKELRGCWP